MHLRLLYLLTIFFVLVSFSTEGSAQHRKTTELDRIIDRFILEKNWKGAEKYLDQSIKKERDLEMALSIRSQLRFYHLDRRMDAIADISRLIELEPGVPDHLHRRAKMKLVLKDISGALNDLDEALKIEPNAVDIVLTRSRAHEAAGNMVGAEADLRLAMNENEDDPYYANLIADFLLRAKRRDDAIILLSDFTKQQIMKNNGQLPKRGWVMQRKTVHNQEVNKALPENTRVANYSMRKVTVSGSLLFREIKIVGSDIENFSKSFLKLGRMHMEKGEVDAALLALEKAIEVDGKMVDAYALRGLIFLSRKNYAASIEEYTKAIKLTDAPDYYLNRGAAKFLLTGEKSASNDFERFLKLNPLGKTILDQRIALIRAELQQILQAETND